MTSEIPALVVVATEAHNSLPAVALPRLAGSAKRVRLFYGDPETGRDWGEENDVTGYVGLSTGTVKAPLLLASRRSTGGTAISVDRVLRMLVDGVETFRHSRYVEPDWRAAPSCVPDLPFAVYRDGKPWANFLTAVQRDRWLAFMRGQRATK